MYGKHKIEILFFFIVSNRNFSPIDHLLDSTQNTRINTHLQHVWRFNKNQKPIIHPCSRCGFCCKQFIAILWTVCNWTTYTNKHIVCVWSTMRYEWNTWLRSTAESAELIYKICRSMYHTAKTLAVLHFLQNQSDFLFTLTQRIK